MNPLAEKLNNAIKEENVNVFNMLSDLGKQLFMPKGILTQTAEAKEKAYKYNATIGIALEKKKPMYLDCIYEPLKIFKPEDLFPYAPNTGKPELRKAWKEKMIKDNPSLKGKYLSLPLVTNALTHGLSIVSDMFIDKGDNIVTPDKYWGNYRQVFAVRRGAEISTFPTFTKDKKFNIKDFLGKVEECGKIKEKVLVLLNFPNNPSGYMPSKNEVVELTNGLVELANNNIKIIALVDDAYFGLNYEDNTFDESIFGLLANRSDNLLAIKLDGATKEEFVWGFRVGFITFASTNNTPQENMLKALESKVAGLIRGTISNCPHASQTFVLYGLNHPDFKKQREEKREILRRRALKIKEVFNKNNYSEAFEYYPFNSGYFMCLKLAKVDAEALRVHLLENYGVGTVSVNKTDLRIAFSCIEEEDIEDLFNIIYKACKDLEG
ncbi:MAG: aminotransferase class I/II-fold pyridoxal phosphate-dependent enzyme [Deferribacterota bacterium]|nr:aminotransferase class I/II-fold pyridoxal phosphate-dependent enzyme [Deferribacterota bacterium]